jgi:hypothetical protein
MNFRPCRSPYMTLHERNILLRIIRVHWGTRIFILWFGQSCAAALVGSIVQCGTFQSSRTKESQLQKGLE